MVNKDTVGRDYDEEQVLTNSCSVTGDTTNRCIHHLFTEKMTVNSAKAEGSSIVDEPGER